VAFKDLHSGVVQLFFEVDRFNERLTEAEVSYRELYLARKRAKAERRKNRRPFVHKLTSKERRQRKKRKAEQILREIRAKRTAWVVPKPPLVVSCAVCRESFQSAEQLYQHKIHHCRSSRAA
jgi:5-methylcytosine-specific restriction endonuclease McrA